MPSQLRRLLSSHEFLQQAIVKHGRNMMPEDVARLLDERERIFSQISRYRSKHTAVTLAQLKFLLEMLSDRTKDARELARLKKRCLAIAERLADGSKAKASASAISKVGELTDDSLRLLDTIADRVAICDANYRYLYSNKANADFHGAVAKDFVGMSPRSIVGSRVFQKLTKPSVDRGLAGNSFALKVGFRRKVGDPVTFAAQLDPLRTSSGKIFAVILVSRDVTSLSIAADSVWTLPGPVSPAA